ncbi:MAG: acyltransferase [Desulfobulbaceae bacterium]|nr:acyltransferase [Desulfobulbaceae bacterium]
MTGYLRFFLAFLVLISHMGIGFHGLNPGVIAVVVFYILAGYVVSHLLRDIIPAAKGQYLKFCKDRFLRIFPLYFYVAFLTALFLFFTSFGAPHVSCIKVINNLLIIPLNYYMYFDSTILSDPEWCLIPQAWSLGAELQAYMLLPLTIVFKRVRMGFVLISFCIYMLANLSFVQPDYFGYRLIPGIFFMFAVGSTLQQINSVKSGKVDRCDTWMPITLWTAILISGIYFYVTQSFSPAYTKETLLGLLIGIPVVFFVTKSSIKLPLNRLLGSLSYGVFLSHFLAIWIVEYFFSVSRNSVWHIFMIASISTCIAYIGVVVIEKKVDAFRLRNGKKLST